MDTVQYILCAWIWRMDIAMDYAAMDYAAMDYGAWIGVMGTARWIRWIRRSRWLQCNGYGAMDTVDMPQWITALDIWTWTRRMDIIAMDHAAMDTAHG